MLLGWPALTGAFLVDTNSDQYLAGYAFREFAAQSLRSGQGFPQWNPYQSGPRDFFRLASSASLVCAGTPVWWAGSRISSVGPWRRPPHPGATENGLSAPCFLPPCGLSYAACATVALARGASWH